MLKEFKEFAMKGNVLDLAVGVVIGGAFGKIVTSLVNDIIMPIVGVLTGGLDFKGLKLIVNSSLTINYGMFIQNVVDFIIVSFSIFLFIKGINKLKREKKIEEAITEKPKISEDILLLKEIRDLLKEGR